MMDILVYITKIHAVLVFLGQVMKLRGGLAFLVTRNKLKPVGEVG